MLYITSWLYNSVFFYMLFWMILPRWFLCIDFARLSRSINDDTCFEFESLLTSFVFGFSLLIFHDFSFNVLITTKIFWRERNSKNLLNTLSSSLEVLDTISELPIQIINGATKQIDTLSDITTILLLLQLVTLTKSSMTCWWNVSAK